MKHKPTYTKPERLMLIHGVLAFTLLMLGLGINYLLPDKSSVYKHRASQYMEEMLVTLRDYCVSEGIAINPVDDPYGSGLVGHEWTEMTTTIGHIEAKRTTLNPNFAGLIVTLLEEADVHPGDSIVLASSGSFPGLLLAGLSAAKAMDLQCETILSLGSSSYGANRLNFNILNMYNIVLGAGLISNPPAGVSLGGEKDLGLGWDQDVLSFLEAQIQNSAYPFIREENLQACVKKKAEILEAGRIKAFINAGGAMANIGTSASILGVKPGVVRHMKPVALDQQGLMHIAQDKGITLIHLLFIKGLVREYGLPWDPVVLPGSDDNSHYPNTAGKIIIRILALIIMADFLYLLLRYRMLYNRPEKV